MTTKGRIFFCTDSERSSGNPLSVIPADVRETCDVEDIVISTNRRSPAQQVTAATYAQDNGLDFILDVEGSGAVTSLDLFLNNRPQWEKNASARQKAFRNVRRQCTDVRIGMYDWGRIGIARDQYGIDQYLEMLRLERAFFEVDFKVIEDYDVGFSPAQWREALKEWVAVADLYAYALRLQGPRRDTYLMFNPRMQPDWKDQTKWVPGPRELLVEKIEHMRRNRLRPMIFKGVLKLELEAEPDAPPDAGGEMFWDVIREMAPKK